MSAVSSINLPIARTGLTEVEIQSVQGPLRGDWLVQGPKVHEFDLEPVSAQAAVAARDVTAIGAINTRRNAWLVALQNASIGTLAAAHAVQMLAFNPENNRTAPVEMPVANAVNDCSISLPLFQCMTADEQNCVIAQVCAYRA